jgi:methylated-DNA-[protein]-cysteine S-methyltransferase
VLGYTHIDSPVGPLLAAGDENALHYLSFPGGNKAFGPRPEWRHSDALFDDLRCQLAAYFAGERRRFDIPLQLSGTPFQNAVWRQLAEIPFGQTRTYGEMAAALGRPSASRAVGAANGSNPLPILLPCHRVIGANGSLVGFGGGLPTKQYLLRHEGVLPRGLFADPR